MRKFEYLIVQGNLDQAGWDRLGEDGWELCYYVGYEKVFKRDKITKE